MANGIIRCVDSLGRIMIPENLRRGMHINKGDSMEIYPRNGEIIIRKYRKSFEQCCYDWYEKNHDTIDECQFMTKGDYTFCIVPFTVYDSPSCAGYAKRFKDDEWNGVIGRVAAYANAMGCNLNKMIGYEG